jgi:hypothetical protein
MDRIKLYVYCLAKCNKRIEYYESMKGKVYLTDKDLFDYSVWLCRHYHFMELLSNWLDINNMLDDKWSKK